MVKSKRNETSLVSQGKLLKKLYEWSGERSVKDFTEKFNRSRQWAVNAFKWDIIPTRDKIAICKAYNIPVEYFSGSLTLPIIPSHIQPVQLVQEPQAKYETVSKVIKLQDDIISRDQRIMELQDEVLRLTRLLQQK